MTAQNNLLRLLIFIACCLWCIVLPSSARNLSKLQKQNFKHHQIAVWGLHDIVNSHNKYNQPPFRREFNSDYRKDDLRIFLEYLLQNNYWFLSAAELDQYFLHQTKAIPATQRNKKPIVLTFDDGYQGIDRNLLPLLQELNNKYQARIKVVLFINPGLMSTIDQDILYLQCDELKKGQQLGFYDVQSHGLSHLKLTEVNINTLSFELLQSKKLLHKCLGQEKAVAKYFAYPYGAYNPKVTKYVSKFYKGAFAYNNQALNLQNTPNFAISRYQVHRKLKPQNLIKITEQTYSR